MGFQTLVRKAIFIFLICQQNNSAKPLLFIAYALLWFTDSRSNNRKCCQVVPYVHFRSTKERSSSGESLLDHQMLNVSQAEIGQKQSQQSLVGIVAIDVSGNLKLNIKSK